MEFEKMRVIEGLDRDASNEKHDFVIYKYFQTALLYLKTSHFLHCFYLFLFVNSPYFQV